MAEPLLRGPIQHRIGGVLIPVSDRKLARGWYGRPIGLDLGEPSQAGGICNIPMADDAGLLLDANRPVAGRSVQPLCFLWTGDRDATMPQVRWTPGWTATWPISAASPWSDSATPTGAR